MRIRTHACAFERLEVWVIIREHAESAIVGAETDTRLDVLCCGVEPSIKGCLRDENGK